MKKNNYIKPATEVVRVDYADGIMVTVSGNSDVNFGDAQDGDDDDEADVKGVGGNGVWGNEW